MRTQTPQNRVQFARALRKVFLGVFAVSAIFAFMVILTPGVTQAATASTVNFQARLETNSGAIVPDGTYNVEFKLYNAASGGSAEWTEDYTYNSGPGATDARIRVANGYLTVNLGSLCPFTAGTCQGYTETSIDWTQQQWLTMNIGGTGSTGTYPTMGDGEMNPRLALTAVPYSFEAGTLGATSGTNVATLSFSTPTSSEQLLLPAASGTQYVCYQGASGCGFLTGSGAGVQLQAGTPPGTPQHGNFNIDGTGIAGVLQAGSLDTASAAALGIGASNATAITLGNATSNILTTINGTVLVKPTSGHDSTTAFQVQSAGGSTTLLSADTTNLKVTVAGDVVNTFSSGLGLTQVSATTTYATNPLWVAVQGKYAYVVEQGGTASLEILDITKPSSPARVGTMALAATTPQQIQVQGHYVYIAERGTSPSYAGVLEIVDVSNPHTPTSVTIVPVANGGPYGVYVSGRYAYVVDSATNDLAIIDVSNPLVPALASTIAVNTSPRKVYVAGNYAYVASFGGTPELQIVKVNNPASPSIVGTVALNNNGDDVSVQGRYAYVTEYGSGTPGLDVVDISNPASPSIVASPSAQAFEYANVVSGRYLFTDGFNFANSMAVLDVSTPSSPSVLQTYTTGLSQPAGMALAGRYLFVANETANNLLVFDVSGLETTAATIHSLEAGSLTVDGNSAFGGDASIQGGLTVGGAAQLDSSLGVNGAVTVASNVNSPTAFQVQNAGGTSVLTIDTASSGTLLVLNAPSGFSGDLLDVQNSSTTQFGVTYVGHIISGGSTPTAAPVSADDCNTGASTLASASLTSATDTKGIVTVTDGNGTGCTAGQIVQITFAHPYATAPIVVISPTFSTAASKEAFVSSVTTTSFYIAFALAPNVSIPYQFMYEVIQ